MMKINEKPTGLEYLIYGFMAVVILVGIIWVRVDLDTFKSIYIREDGVLEYFTSIMLFAASVLMISRIARIGFSKGAGFVVMSGLIAFLMFFGAGEEISWGQRILGVESSEFFLENNRQRETNFHNMEVNGVNLNKLIFGKMLTTFLVLYYLVLPPLYRRKEGLRNLLDRFYVPVPYLRYGLALLIAGLSILLVTASKKGELNEVCLSVMFFLTLYAPMNAYIYDREDT
ncbi:hypothetical protein [Shimia sp. SDUM112013]|uniref:hypothetical protein n=1 Tax=Shimia sp. SDUM112013 TaxID=3136160 RepID=UPI0032EE874F